MKKLIFLIFTLTLVVSPLVTNAYIQASLEQANTPNGRNFVRIKLRPDLASAGTHTISLATIAMRYKKSNTVDSISVDSNGYGVLQRIGRVTDPTNANYWYDRFELTTSSSSINFVAGDEYNLGLFEINGVAGQDSIQLVHESTQLLGYLYIELDEYIDATNYAFPFYGNTYDETFSSVNYHYTSIANVPLPVDLIYFEAYRSNATSAKLEWATATEEHNKGFHVQRSADGRTWKEIAFVPSKAKYGYSFTKLMYDLDDPDVYKPLGMQEVFYYRLRQVDIDGTEDYSPVRIVRFGDGVDYTINMYPNPAQNFVTISQSYNRFDYLDVTIIDAVGRAVIFNQTITNNNLDLSSITSGSYKVIIRNPKGEILELKSLIINK
jgi:hypothetical protein